MVGSDTPAGHVAMVIARRIWFFGADFGIFSTDWGKCSSLFFVIVSSETFAVRVLGLCAQYLQRHPPVPVLLFCQMHVTC
jgi:hypothetical protein